MQVKIPALQLAASSKYLREIRCRMESELAWEMAILTLIPL